MARSQLSEKEILAQVTRARVRAAEAEATRLRAVSAKYDEASKRVVVETTTGHLFGFPTLAIAALRRASTADLRQVELTPSGGGLHWERLDVDLEVPALILAVVGRQERIRELARTAGSTTSDRKAAAARANGAKGGRPGSQHFEHKTTEHGFKVYTAARSGDLRIAAKNAPHSSVKRASNVVIDAKSGKRSDSKVAARRK